LAFFSIAGPIPLRVREADVPIVSESECVRQINAVTEKIFIMTASSFCAGGEAGNDTCQVKLSQNEIKGRTELIFWEIFIFTG
jgi:hypothetical protein